MTWDATTAPTPAGTCCQPKRSRRTGCTPTARGRRADPTPGRFFDGSDGGLMRIERHVRGHLVAVRGRPLSAARAARRASNCSAVPTNLTSLNTGLSTLQFQSLSVAPDNPNHLQGGTQDNGTFDGIAGAGTWPQEIYGDGGQSGFNAGNSALRFNTFTPSARTRTSRTATRASGSSRRDDRRQPRGRALLRADDGSSGTLPSAERSSRAR